jgi:4-diphosphocytidyl-2-C-methyl-D-erythritol kinase
MESQAIQEGPDRVLNLPAPAKLNLFLHITGRRNDGYHSLQSVFVLLDWCDHINLYRREDGLLKRHDLGLALPEMDLSLQAAMALQQASGTHWGADMEVRKVLPWGAGLGGGSSDAATTLMGLNRLWGLNWPQSRLLELALRLGADVPFFVRGHSAWVEGIGENILPLEMPPSRFHVIKPASSLSTALVFSQPDLTRNTPRVRIEEFVEHMKFAWHSGLKDVSGPTKFLFSLFGRNDLQPAAEKACPEVSEALAILRQVYGNSRMSGSGSAVFSLLAPQIDDFLMHNTDPVASSLKLPALWVSKVCSSLSSHPILGWLEDKS